MTGDPRIGALTDDESLVDLRCSVVVRRDEHLLLVQRGTARAGDWVLPGGRPRHGESMHSCARREALEETGIRVTPGRCAFVGEVIDTHRQSRVVELVFLAEEDRPEVDQPLVGEPGTIPQWVPVKQIASLRLRPPIAGYVTSISPGARAGAAYLGNLWRPDHDLAARAEAASDRLEQLSGP